MTACRLNLSFGEEQTFVDTVEALKVLTDADGKERALTADDLVSALQTDPSVSGLTALLGEPNAVWDVYCRYYYELSDGSWIGCCTYLEHTDLHVNNNEDLIGYAYYADEAEQLGTLWKIGQ